MTTLVEKIDAVLPQTQCTQCDFPRCLEYAEAIEDGTADINQCPPGGQYTIDAIAGLMDRKSKSLNTAHGISEPKVVAYIQEDACIGCRLCIKACPVDCIIGSGKLMHTVISVDCTGCKLCVPVCPTDCIDLIPAVSADGTPSPWPDFSREQVDKARYMTEFKIKRQAEIDAAKKQNKLIKKRAALKLEIEAALRRNSNKS